MKIEDEIKRKQIIIELKGLYSLNKHPLVLQEPEKNNDVIEDTSMADFHYYDEPTYSSKSTSIQVCENISVDLRDTIMWLLIKLVVVASVIFGVLPVSLCLSGLIYSFPVWIYWYINSYDSKEYQDENCRSRTQTTPPASSSYQISHNVHGSEFIIKFYDAYFDTEMKGNDIYLFHCFQHLLIHSSLQLLELSWNL